MVGLESDLRADSNSEVGPGKKLREIRSLQKEMEEENKWRSINRRR